MVIGRPKSLLEASRQINDGKKENHAVKEFIDEYRRFKFHQYPTSPMYLDEPEVIQDKVTHVFFAALAEYLAFLDQVKAPEWTEKRDRFLSRPVFFGGDASREYMIQNTTFSCRKRMLFCGEIDPGDVWSSKCAHMTQQMVETGMKR